MRRLLILLVLSTAAATGCGGPTAAPAPPTADTPPTATQAARPTTTTPAAPSAADGTDLSACDDGECEVLVDGPADIPFADGVGFASIRVLADASGPQLEVFGIAGQGGTIGGAGCTSFAEGGIVEIEPVDADTALVRVGAGQCS